VRYRSVEAYRLRQEARAEAARKLASDEFNVVAEGWGISVDVVEAQAKGVALREQMMAEMAADIREQEAQEAWDAERERKAKEMRAWIPKRYTFECDWGC
jgi:hypothetical protein